MDPFSQGLVAAALPQALGPQKKIRAFGLIGFLSGLTPDLDILIHSSTDSLLAVEYHRHFTHSLLFIPIGALICAGILFYPFKKHLSFKLVYLAALLGYATHGLLDAATSYGTQLFIPFSNIRIAWHAVSIIDPIFTGILFLLVVLSFVKRSKKLGKFGLAWIFVYLGIGLGMQQRAVNALESFAKDKGHEIERSLVKPSFGNIVLFKAIYRYEGHFYVNAVNVFGSPLWYEGDRIPVMDLVIDLPWIVPGSVHYRDVGRFNWFSNHYTALDSKRENFIMDVSYSLLPNEIDPLWGIYVNPKNPEEHVLFVSSRMIHSNTRSDLMKMIFRKPLK